MIVPDRLLCFRSLEQSNGASEPPINLTFDINIVEFYWAGLLVQARVDVSSSKKTWRQGLHPAV